MSRKIQTRRHTHTLFAGALAASALTAAADIPTRVVVRTNDQIPGEVAGHTFTFFGSPSINATGVTAFRSQAYGFGIFLGTPSGALTRVAVGSDPAPDLPAGTTFSIPDAYPTLNARGAVAFTSLYSGPNNIFGTGAFSNATGSFQSVILPGDPLVAHPNNGTFSSFATNRNPVLIADNGATAYYGRTSTFPNADGDGIWAGVGKSGAAKVALEGDAAPTLEAGTVYSWMYYPVMNPSGTLAFRSTVSGPKTTFYNTDLIWAGTPGNVRPVVRSESIAPGTTAKFYSFNDPDISSTGKVAFRARLDTSQPFDQREGVWTGTAGHLTLAARSGTPAAGANGATFYSFSDPLVNAAGTVSFAATLNGTGVSTSTNGTGLWTGPDASHLTLVARVGDHAPGTAAGDVFAWPSAFAHVLNNLGQIAFAATMTGGDVTSSNDSGLWVYDPINGTQLVAREGQTINIRGQAKTISSIDLRVNASSGDGRATSLNNNGQLAFTAGLAGGIDYAVLVADVGGVLPGDANRDGIVDRADFSRVLANMNAPGSFGDGDFNGDGMVTFADYQLLEMNYGKTNAAFAATPGAALNVLDTSVPEPGGATVLGLASVGLLRRRRRAHR